MIRWQLAFLDENTVLDLTAHGYAVRSLETGEVIRSSDYPISLYPNRVPGQEAGVIALATDEKERRIVLCYAADTAWLGPVLAIMNSKQ